MAYKNKEDQARNAKKHYELNKDLIKKRAKNYKVINQNTIKEYVNELKLNPCTDCKQTFHSIAMDFDHVRGTKIKAVSQMINSGFGLEKIKLEIEKCDLVCSNCHRIRTHERRSKSGD
jgi:hypothetical protein